MVKTDITGLLPMKVKGNGKGLLSTIKNYM